MSSVFIIAEAGVNHNGDIKLAKKLVDVAVEAGVDAVKFQTFKAETLVCKSAKKADYQLETTDGAETQFEMLKKLELTKVMHEELLMYCREKQIMFLSTPFDVESVSLLNNYGIEIMKIPSGEITNYPYLQAVGETGKRVILSTGMSTMDEVEDAVKVLQNYGTENITLLHCNTEYPAPMCDVNLNSMIFMKKAFHVPVGYSDHTKGIEVPIAAVAMGATVIEKHFTLDRNMEGPDHKASLEPDELKAMVKAIRNIEDALGSSEKKVTASEEKNRAIARKSIVAKRHIDKGETFTVDNITTKRPGSGISPMKWNAVLGRKAIREFEEDELIEIEEE